MRRTRQTILFMAVLGLTACTVAAPETEVVGQLESKVVYKQNLKGGTAYASTYNNDSSVHVYASETGTGQNAAVYLDYHVSTADPTSEVCVPAPPSPPGKPPLPDYCYYTRYVEEWGYGTIPGSALHIGHRSAKLDTVVAVGADFFIERCVFDNTPQPPPPPGETCATDADCEPGYFCDFKMGLCMPFAPPPPPCGPGTGGAIVVSWVSDGMQSWKRTGTEEWRSGSWWTKTSGMRIGTTALAQGMVAGTALNGAWGNLENSKGVTREILKQ